MRCTKCGAECAENVKNCPSCGASISAESVKRKKTPIGVIIAIIAVAVFALAVGLYFVLKVNVEQINIIPVDSHLYIGETYELEFEVLPDNAWDKELVWVSSDDTVATVDAKGVVTAVAAGDVTITATAKNDIKGEVELAVVLEPETITYTEPTGFIYVGAEHDLAPVIAPAGSVYRSLVWTSSDEAVATVNENGVVTAIGKGEAILTAELDNGVTVEVPFKVSVRPDIIVLRNIDNIMFVGEEITADVGVMPSDAEYEGITWESSDDTVITVDEDGKLVAIDDGVTTITATAADGVSESIEVTVYEYALDAVIAFVQDRGDFHDADDYYSYDIINTVYDPAIPDSELLIQFNYFPEEDDYLLITMTTVFPSNEEVYITEIIMERDNDELGQFTSMFMVGEEVGFVGQGEVEFKSHIVSGDDFSVYLGIESEREGWAEIITGDMIIIFTYLERGWEGFNTGVTMEQVGLK